MRQLPFRTRQELRPSGRITEQDGKGEATLEQTHESFPIWNFRGPVDRCSKRRASPIYISELQHI